MLRHEHHRNLIYRFKCGKSMEATFVCIVIKFDRQLCKLNKSQKTRKVPGSLFFTPMYRGAVCCLPKVAREGKESTEETTHLKMTNKDTSTSDNLDCRHFKFCDGCTLEQNLAHPPCSKKIEEYFWKKRVAVRFHSDTLLHGWRSIARLAVRRDTRGRTKIGLFQEDTHTVVEIPQCRVHHPLINEGIQRVKAVMEQTGVIGYNEDRGKGDLRYIQMSVEHHSQTVQAAFVWNAARLKEAGPSCNQFMRELSKSKRCFHSLWLNFNTSRGNRIFSYDPSSWLLYSGKRYIVENIGGVEIYFPPYAFRQSNMEMFKKLVDEVSKHVDSKMRVLEFYAGVGAIGIPVAYLSGAQLTGACELNSLSKEAYLKASLVLPASQRRNAEFFVGTAAAHRDKLRFSEVIIADPPRSGMDYALAARISSARNNERLKRLIYVSCKFESLQRDLEIIQRNGIWKLRKADAFLFFPGTDHWELLCVLDRTM